MKIQCGNGSNNLDKAQVLVIIKSKLFSPIEKDVVATPKWELFEKDID